MSVGLAELESGTADVETIELSASNYDSDTMRIEQGDQTIDATRKQLQGISIAIDRFLAD